MYVDGTVSCRRMNGVSALRHLFLHTVTSVTRQKHRSFNSEVQDLTLWWRNEFCM